MPRIAKFEDTTPYTNVNHSGKIFIYNSKIRLNQTNVL